MIRIQYTDKIVNRQLYCVLQVQRELNEGEYAFLYMARWFGSAEVLPPPGRGELLALAATTSEYRHELLLASPKIESEPEKVLSQWRSKFQRIEYCPLDFSVQTLLEAEASILAESDERAVVDEIMVKNLPPSVFYEPQDAGCQLNSSGSVSDLDPELFVYALVEAPAKVVGYRRAFSKKHLKEIILQANEHNLLVYYSPFKTEGKRIVAEGPWVLMPPSLRNYKRPQTTVDVSEAVDTDVPPQFEEEVKEETVESTESVPVETQDTEPVGEHEVVKNADGLLVCPYCGKTTKSMHGMTNHVKGKHPEKLDDYLANRKD